MDKEMIKKEIKEAVNVASKEDIELDGLIARSFDNLQKLINSCADTKSGKSVKCGYEKDLDVLYLIGGKLSYEEKKKLIRRLGRLDKVDWEEISKEVYLKEEGYCKENYKVVNGKFYRK